MTAFAAPATSDVAAHLRARLVSSGGVPQEDFTAFTFPTLEQANTLIRLSMNDVIASIGTLDSCTSPIADELRDEASGLVAIRAAMRIERTHFPNEVKSNGSPYEALKEEWLEGRKTLIERVSENCAGGGDGDDPGESVGPRGPLSADTFPDDPPLAGYRSIW